MIPILYSGNSFAFDGILISLLSIMKHTKSAIHAYVLTMDLSDVNASFKPLDESMRNILESVCKEHNPDSSVTLIDVGELYRSELLNSPNKNTFYTPYSFLRLFADRIDILPKKILYLDIDTLAREDISSLINTDISDYELAGSLDYYGDKFLSKGYINSGVLYLNLDMIRMTSLFKRCIELINQKRLYLPDQNAINKFVQKKLTLPRKYNEQMKVQKDTVIQHFVTTTIWFPIVHKRKIKPWHVSKMKRKHPEFNDILDKYALVKKI
ncbi:MAG: glycosyltransferase family 8 protein [Clostridia bacterium]|nr:glycosyltransferase family 8 protein [Clostridia bacterium]